MAKKTMDEILATAPVSGEEAAKIRKKQGEFLAANGFVKSKQDHDEVTSDSGRHDVVFERDSFACTCDDYVGATTIGIEDYACEHIYAVMATKDIEFGSKGEMKPVSAIKQGEQEVKRETNEEFIDKLVDTFEEAADDIRTLAFRQFTKPLPEHMIKQREAKWSPTGYVKYVDWPSVADVLDKVAGPNWSFEIQEIIIGQYAVTCHASLYVFGVKRDGVGVLPIRMDRNGEPLLEVAIKGAPSDALKRAAVMFGIGRELYSDDDVPVTENGRPATSGAATYQGEMMTPKQSGLIKAIAREAGVDPEEECRKFMKCEPPDLSKRLASDFIEHLQSLQPRQAEAAPRRAQW